MTDTLVKDVAETMPGQRVPESEAAVSFLPSFGEVRGILESSPAPRRPNRNRPIYDSSLEEELSCWQAAGEEALELFENSLDE